MSDTINVSEPMSRLTKLIIAILVVAVVCLTVACCSKKVIVIQNAEATETGFSGGEETPPEVPSKSSRRTSPNVIPTSSGVPEIVIGDSGKRYRFGYVEGNQPKESYVEITIEAKKLSEEYSADLIKARKIGVEETTGIWAIVDGKTPFPLPARGGFPLPADAKTVRFFSNKAFSIRVSE